MSEVCQVKIHVSGKLQEKSLTRSKKIVKFTQLKEVKFSGRPRNNPHLKFGILS